LGRSGWLLAELPKARWFLRERAAAAAETAWLLSTWDALAFRLSGEAVASFWDPARSLSPSQRALLLSEAGGLDERALPPEVFPGTRIGALRPLAASDLGLSSGIPIVSGTNDGMAAVIGLDEGPCREVCEATGVTLANLNCPGQIVISGDLDRIPAAVEAAKAKGAKKAIPLTVAGAYHSPLMASAQPRLLEALSRIPLCNPQVPVVSNVTALPHGSAETISPILVDQVTSSVRWEASMRYLLAQGFTRFIELGPGSALSGFLRRIDKSAQAFNVCDVASLEATVLALGGV
jgi:hypothetical protein